MCKKSLSAEAAGKKKEAAAGFYMGRQLPADYL
jgi:hypothetical protein